MCYLPLKGLYYLREEFSDGQSYVEFDDGRQARSETIYHYAPYIRVVKAIACFILYDGEGLETVNRLVETDLKSALVQGKPISGGGTSHS